MSRWICALAMIALLSFGCSEDDNPAAPESPDYDYYVDAGSGEDTNPGSESEPWRTVTHAVGTADPDMKIRVLPGTYDAAHGETFPIELKEGQALVGDDDNKGDGAEPTEIYGYGEFMTGWYATVLGAEGSGISGFKIGDPTSRTHHFAVVSDSVTMQVSFNTVIHGVYGGVYIREAGTTTVSFNDFENNSYGVYMADCPEGPTVSFNTFASTIAIPVNLQSPGSYAVIADNTITGNGQVGIQLQDLTSALVDRNTFNQTGGYTYGAISCDPGITAGIRWNVFSCTTAVILRGNALPTLGMDALPGNNDFSQVTGASIRHEGTESIYAIGNTWPNYPPLAGTDIVVSGGGTIIYGTGPDDHIP